MITEQDFENLFNNTSVELVKYAYFRIGDVEKAKDVVQEAFVILWRKRQKFEPDQTKRLLYSFITNLIVDNYRKENVRIRFANSKMKVAHSTVNGQYEMEHSEFQQRLEDAISNLPEKQRVVFLMNRLEEYKYREIAELLSISQKTVEKRMQLALQTIRNAIGHSI